MTKKGENAFQCTLRLACDSQPPDFKVLTIHDDVVEAKKNWEPELDHWVVHMASLLRWWNIECTLWAHEHDRYHPSEHGDRKQADLLVLVHLTEIGDAYS